MAHAGNGDEHQLLARSGLVVVGREETLQMSKLHESTHAGNKEKSCMHQSVQAVFMLRSISLVEKKAKALFAVKHLGLVGLCYQQVAGFAPLVSGPLELLHMHKLALGTRELKHRGLPNLCYPVFLAGYWTHAIPHLVGMSRHVYKDCNSHLYLPPEANWGSEPLLPG